jgi:hypothetical protein
VVLADNEIELMQEFMKLLEFINTVLTGAGSYTLTSLTEKLERISEYMVQAKEICESLILAGDLHDDAFLGDEYGISPDGISPNKDK